MRKKILIGLALLSILVMAAVPALNLARVTIINKTGYELQVKIEEVGEPQNVKYLEIPVGTKDDPTERIYDLYALGDDWEWYITGWAKTTTAIVTNPDGTVKYWSSFPCYGEADAVYWDEHTATRIFWLNGVGENKNKVLFTEDSCQIPSPKWFDLPGKNYFYTRKSNSFVY